ncbi:leucine-rich repeat and immunoglobulin-like domain containing-NOGO receptor-interacting protein 4 [Pristis pectinata]|uniref:leucine-rich repeat and immunoglobulin-like domain containing-NOGO receptor-interacting protein 4 n=1 Tax=Pristis pectinata TaxID=685728 RepID=UPI00223E6F20|nr:leucine-rich repeat and immunoglobulin-like domain containing-NOGO receptor-interacting protein 4 [Pristis pectinata]
MMPTGRERGVRPTLALMLLACVRGCFADCPSVCDCGSGNGTAVCRGRGLTAAPERLPSDTAVLDLSGNRIGSLGRGALANLTALEELDIGDNLLSDIQPGALSGLRSLSTLRLAGNRLRTLWPGALPCAPNLTTLELGRNPLVLLLDGAFQGLPGLQRLELGEQLAHVQPGAFAGLGRLRHLAFGMAGAGAVPTAALSPLGSLGSLRLSGLGATTLPADAFRGLRGLRHLRIERWPRLAALSPDALGGLNLTRLAVTHCNLSSVPGRALGHLVYLQSLDLSHNPIAVLPEGSLQGLPRLRELRLADGGLAEIQAGAFQGLGRLRALDLSGNRLATLEERALERPGGLEALGLGANPLACDCRLRWLRAGSGRLDWGPRPPVCASPEGARGRELAELGPGELSCSRPRIRARPPAEVTVAEGQTVSLACGAEGRPAPRVSWATPGGRVLSGGEGGRLRVLADGSLEVRLAQSRDAGSYLCTASNAAGSEAAAARLLVRGWGPTAAGTRLDPAALSVVLTLGSACFLGVTGLCFALLLLWSRLKGPIKRTSSVEVLRHPSGTDAQSEAIKYTTKML